MQSLPRELIRQITRRSCRYEKGETIDKYLNAVVAEALAKYESWYDLVAKLAFQKLDIFPGTRSPERMNDD